MDLPCAVLVHPVKLGSGPLLLGHAPPEVVEAVQRQVAAGSTFFALTEPAILLAEQLVQAVPRKRSDMANLGYNKTASVLLKEAV
jgi:glutamate-1-semialdehyde 2,1-aminomutase